MNDLLPVVGALGVLLLYSGLTSTGRRGAPWLIRVDRAVDEAGLGVRSTHLIAGTLVAIPVAFIAGAGTTGSSIVGAMAAAGAAWAPVAYVRSRRLRRRRLFREAWPDALATMIAGIRAGVSLPETCMSLAERGPEQLRPAFHDFTSTYRASGSFHAALDGLRVHLTDPIADRVSVALGLAHDVGGTDLVRVLRTLADFVREDLRIRKEIEARWSWTVTAARIAAASPWIVLLMMSTRPEAAIAYASPGGGLVVLCGGIATVLGYRAMLRAAQLPEDRRLQG